MTEQRTGFRGFVRELRRRHVFRTLLAYGAVAFVVLQLGEIILPAFDVGDWGLQLLVVIAVLGLPVVLALAWVYEITPAGIRTMREIDEEAGRRLEAEASLLPRLAFLTVTVLAATGAGAFWVRTSVSAEDEGRRGGGRPPVEAPETFVSGQASEADVPIRSLAVLPFESFSVTGQAGAAGADDRFFARGMHEALLSRLSQVASSFRVISRTTVQGYDASGKSVTQVGMDLGVEGIIEGSVFSDGERVRITVQLIHAPSDTHVWAGDYEREMKDLIALQAEVSGAISEAIVGRLDAQAELPDRLAEAGPPGAATDTVTLDPEEGPTDDAGEFLTVDPEAATSQMRGRMALFGEEAGEFEEAQRYFEEAIREDSLFGLAWSGLAGTRLGTLLGGAEYTPESLSAVEEAAEHALRMDSTNPEALDVLAIVEGLRSQLDSSVAGIGPGGVPPPDTIRSPDVGVVVRRRPEGVDRLFGPAHTELGARLQAMSSRALAGEELAAEARVEAAMNLIAFGRFEQAHEVLRNVTREAPEYDPGWVTLEHLLVLEGELDEVVTARGRRAETGGASRAPGAPSVEALSQAIETSGERGYWEWRLEELQAMDAAGADLPRVVMATAYAALGRADPALELLAEAAAEGDGAIVTTRADPVWDPYRRDPRFRQALRSFAEVAGVTPSRPRPRGGPGLDREGADGAGRSTRDGEAVSGRGEGPGVPHFR